MSTEWHSQLSEARQRLRNRFEGNFQHADAQVRKTQAETDAGSSRADLAQSEKRTEVSDDDAAISEDEVSHFLLSDQLGLRAGASERAPVESAHVEPQPVDAQPVGQPAPVTDADEPTCRICFCGAEEEIELGRLFSPCRCTGTSRYVHRHCLEEWRRASSSYQSFYRCDQCFYEYKLDTGRFFVAKLIRSRAALLGVTCLVFLLIVYAAGFLANYVISAAERRAARMGDNPWEGMFISDFQIVGENVKEAATMFERTIARQLKKDSTAPKQVVGSLRRSGTRRLPALPIDELPIKDTNALQRLAVHLGKGLSLVGIGSFFHSFIASTFLGPFGLRGSFFRALRPGRRRNGNEPATAMQVVLVTFVLLGAIKALTKVYSGVRWLARRSLQRLETYVLEV